MEQENINIEQLFRREFEDFRPEPSPVLWEKIRRKMAWQKFLQFRAGSLNIYYTAAALILTVSFVMFQQKQNESGFSNLSVSEEITSHGSQLQGQPEQTAVGMAEKTEESLSETNKSASGNKKTDENPSLSSQGNKSKSEKGSFKTQEDKLKDTEKDDNSNEYSNEQEDFRSSIIAFFVPSVFQGCVPLQVQFTNLSNPAGKSSWSFGDGGSSDQANPVYIFDEPGEYIVNLSVRNNLEEMNSFSQIIQVFPAPEVNFRMDIQDNGQGGIPVYFYNYTSGAEHYHWDFGDGGTSVLSEPSWIYNSKGEFDIKLVAESDYGCRDSMILKNIFEEGLPVINLPNAFSPNTTGPTGGYYNQKDPGNDVFHPWFEEAPVEYQLRIFNRKGNLIFESNEISIGWDGYYQQSLLPQGVYVYKLRAKFKNGKTVVKMGDITLFHEQ